MPAYHSSYNEESETEGHQLIGNLVLLPFNSKIRGPALTPADSEREDIIQESLELFRANCLFRNFEIKGSGDRLLIYLILFIGDCLSRINSAKLTTKPQAIKSLLTFSSSPSDLSLPGEPSFPLNSLYSPPASKMEAEQLRNYLVHARMECSTRLCERVYGEGLNGSGDGASKWWMGFQKRKFMGKSLSSA